MAIMNNNYLCGDYQVAEQQDRCSSFSHDLLVQDNDNDDKFPFQSSHIDEEEMAILFERENMHLPREDYLKRLQNGDLDATLRRDSIDWIAKVIDYYDFGPLTAYLSANYLDRFVSINELPAGNPWMMQLLAVTCLSLAAKVEETRRPPSLYLQVCEPKFIFQVTTIKRMELLVLSTLNWRMVSVTPFSFIDYFLTKINGHKPSRTSISRSFQLILSSIRGTGFLNFKPSEIAASIAICVSSGETLAVDYASTISCFIQQEKLLKCIKMIQEVPIGYGFIQNENSSLSSVTQSPNGVLDAACWFNY
ncbi:hypothetical protein MKX01_042598 [Papaver californicum]|nr:hypothetical protein MKX01_042598 [Papaver californicum]